MTTDCGTCDSDAPVPVAVWEGELRIGPVRVPCYVLDDGRRVISAEGINDLFAYFASGGEMNDEEARELAHFARAQA